MSRKPATAVPMVIDRNFPATAFADTIKAIHASGVVDQTLMWDQMTSWYPPCLWTPERTPMARVIPDLDSYPDWFAMASYGAAHAPGMGTVISMDAIRRGPAEMVQSMATLANITQGRSVFQVGAGEVKQCKPFGWKRSTGMQRLEDFYRAFHALWAAEGPIDFQGHITQFERAWLGVARQHRPRIWGLGGGPKVLDLATTYADGFGTMAPFVWSSPAHAAEEIARMKAALREKGRDPEAFDFGAWGAVLLHEDPSVIDRALDDPVIRWNSVIFGRINQGDWDREGIEPPMPRDWHYSLKLLPVNIGAREADEMIARVTRPMSEKTWIYGTPQKVAEDLQAYVDAGVTWIGVVDILPMVLPPEDAAGALSRSLQVCRLLKGP